MLLFYLDDHLVDPYPPYLSKLISFVEKYFITVCNLSKYVRNFKSLDTRRIQDVGIYRIYADKANKHNPNPKVVKELRVKPSNGMTYYKYSITNQKVK